MATFHPFPRLPLELRIQIWEEAFTQDRVLRVRERTVYLPPFAKDYWSSTQVPAITRACQESRRYCSYQKAFTIDGSTQYIWVDFANDIIQMSSWIIPALLEGECIEKREIRHLRLELGGVDGHDGTESFYHDYSRRMRNFPKLQSCDVLIHDGLYSWGMFIDETYWGACPKHNVRLVDAKTGEYIDAKTSPGFFDYLDTNRGEYRHFGRPVFYFVEEWEEEEEFAERWAEMMKVGTNPLPRIDLNY
ncbi:hypothetical protein BKA63DRAFT_504994 [Paraphoma chrysanthemicola]|nr:hypothetical protein BKA63DRAFT_504994 [Paraphoma chrysanthemicola]